MIHCKPITLEGHGVRLEPLAEEHRDALSAAIEQLLDDPARARAIGHAARETTLAGHGAASKYEQVLQTVLAPSPIAR